MNHEQAEHLLSTRIDGERISPRAATALDEHLASCAACSAFERGAYRLREAARFELAPAVPDLVGEVMAAVASEPGRRSRLRVVRPTQGRRGILPRLAPAIAAVLVGTIAGSVAVGGPWQGPTGDRALAASAVTQGIAAAAVDLDAYQATFAITEHHLAPDVPLRDLTMNVWFEAPERFRLDVTDHTSPSARGDLRLIVDGSNWYAAGPTPCPTDTCPRREYVVRNRLPFSTAAPIPTDLVLPLSTLADAEGITVLGHGTVLGRPAVRVEVPFERAEPLFPFLELGGRWRPFYPKDRVRIWLDERSWFPLRWDVFPAAGGEREAWALRFGLPDEPSRDAVFSAVALEVALSTPAPGVFDIPAGVRAQDQGARVVELADVRSAAGFEPVAPPRIAGLDLYTVVVPEDGVGTLVAYADGLSFLALGESRTWDGDAPFGPIDLQAEEVALSGGGVAYFEPATPSHARRISIHAAGTDLYLESNLPRADLLAAAATLPVLGLPMPESWTARSVGGVSVRRVSLEQARTARLGFEIELPAALPGGFGLASVELVQTGDAIGVTLYLRQRDADPGTGTIRLHLEARSELPPATSAVQSTVRLGDVRARFTPVRSQLEWVQDGVYRSLDAPGLSLSELVAIAASIGPQAG